MEYLTIQNTIPTLIWCGSCLSSIKLRKELAEKAGIEITSHDETLKIARQEAFSAYFYLLMRSFGGGIMANLALGLSPLQPFLDPSHIICATLAWITVFYCPGDFTYRFYMDNSFVYTYLEITNEIWRALKIFSGIQVAAATNLVTDDSLRIVYYAVIGTVKGNGADIFHIIKNFTIGDHQISIPSVIKMSFVASVPLSIPFVLNTSYNNVIFYCAIALFLGNQLLTIIRGEECETFANYLLAGVAICVIITVILLNIKFLGTLVVSAEKKK